MTPDWNPPWVTFLTAALIVPAQRGFHAIRRSLGRALRRHLGQKGPKPDRA